MTYISDPRIEKQVRMNLKAHEAREKKAEEQRSAERAEKFQEIEHRHRINNLSPKVEALCEALDRLPQAINEALGSASMAYPVELPALSDRELEILCLKHHGLLTAGFEEKYGISYAEFESIFKERESPVVIHSVNEGVHAANEMPSPGSWALEYLTDGPSKEAQLEVDCLRVLGCSYVELKAGIVDAVQRAIK